MSGIRYAHVTIAGNSEEALKHGLTVKAKCGLIFVPKAVGKETDAFPPCSVCHKPKSVRSTGQPHFVYRCFDADGRLIYVGVTYTPLKRMEQHRGGAWWFEQVDQIKYTVWPDRARGLEMERRAIADENPRWNIRGRDRALWGADDYADFHTALTRNGASAQRVNRICDEARRRYSIELPEAVPA